MRPQLLVATGNRGKLVEVRRIIGDKYELLCNDDFPGIVMPEEDGLTFADNAAKKALAAAGQAGIPTLADDSGLAVDSLCGAPGVLSARYGGEELKDDISRYELLLERMRGIPPEYRSARFVSAVALALPGKLIAVREGKCEGSVIFEPRGENGFGYDPIFVPSGYDLTYAELPGEVKDRISHRYKALMAILPEIGRLFGQEISS